MIETKLCPPLDTSLDCLDYTKFSFTFPVCATPHAPQAVQVHFQQLQQQQQQQQQEIAPLDASLIAQSITDLYTKSSKLKYAQLLPYDATTGIDCSKQDLFLINICEVNIEQISSDPIQRHTFKNGGFLHAVAQVIAWLNLDTTPTTPHPGCSVTLQQLDHPDYQQPVDYPLYDYYQKLVINSLNDMYNVTINPLDALEALNVTILHHTDDC